MPTCPIYLIPNSTNGNCDNCKLLNLGFSYNDTCISGTTCPNDTVLDNISRNGCHTCKSINKYYNDGICVDTCPSLKPSNSDNICTACTTDKKYLQNGVCVQICDLGSIYDSDNVCTPCASNEPYIFNNKCLSSCGYLCTDSNKICYNAKNASPEQYWFDGKCYDKIQSNTALFNTDYNVYKKCNDLEQKQYNYLSGCVLKCPEGTLLDNSNSDCLAYSTSGIYLISFILYNG